MTKTLQISDAEWRVMHEVWLDEPITSRELKERLVSTTGWKIATIKTLLHRLVQKGILSYYRKGNRHYYRSVSTRTECMQFASHAFLDTVFDGRRVHMLTYLVQTARLSTDELRYFKNVVQNIVAAESDSVSSDSA